jgi:hypothetical protein
MESDEVWNKALDWSPGDSEGLSRYLDDRALKRFPGLLCPRPLAPLFP